MPDDTTSSKNHWQALYQKKAPDEVSWYQPHLRRSLALIEACGLGADARIVDVGGGASTLVDDLLDAGFRDIGVIDIAEEALAKNRKRLGERAQLVDWIVGDAASELLPPVSVDCWHDRAVFHFLIQPEAREAYLEQLARCVKKGGYVLIASFGPDGPERCSGLPVIRYDADRMLALLGAGFEKIDEVKEEHKTPSGVAQSFVYCLFRRRA